MTNAHGHSIAHALERCSSEILQLEHGSLYPAPYRLEDVAGIVSFVVNVLSLPPCNVLTAGEHQIQDSGAGSIEVHCHEPTVERLVNRELRHDRIWLAYSRPSNRLTYACSPSNHHLGSIHVNR